MKFQDGNFPTFLLICFFLAVPHAAQEIVRSTFCWNQDFRLDCSNSSNILAIHKAVFTNDPQVMNKSGCGDGTEIGTPCAEDLRIPLNKRCSGMSHCHFNLTQDHPETKCICRGVIELVYACVNKKHISSSCNVKLNGPLGYISSPTYPGYYPKISECLWTIESSNGQEVMLTVLDMDLKKTTRHRGMDVCYSDSMTILEDGHKLRQMCGAANNETQRPFISRGGKVTVKFSSADFAPSRGFLIYYKCHGCPILSPPPSGYLVYQNKTNALYMCCKDHFFNDTMQTSRALHCIDDYKWNATITACLTLDEIHAMNNNLSTEALVENNTVVIDVVEISLKRAKYFEDILIPAASVVGLLFGNVAVILVIMKIRKKRKFGSCNGTPTPQPNATPTPVPAPPPVSNSVPRAPQVLMSDL